MLGVVAKLWPAELVNGAWQPSQGVSARPVVCSITDLSRWRAAPLVPVCPKSLAVIMEQSKRPDKGPADPISVRKSSQYGKITLRAKQMDDERALLECGARQAFFLLPLNWLIMLLKHLQQEVPSSATLLKVLVALFWCCIPDCTEDLHRHHHRCHVVIILIVISIFVVAYTYA